MFLIPGVTIHDGDPFPDELRDWDEEPCWAIGPPRPLFGYCCARTKGHSGCHIARDSDGTVLDAWTEKPKKPQRRTRSRPMLPGDTS